MSYNDHIRIFDWTEISLKTLQLKHSDIQKNQTKKSTYWWCSGDKLCQQNKQMHILHNQNSQFSSQLHLPQYRVNNLYWFPSTLQCWTRGTESPGRSTQAVVPRPPQRHQSLSPRSLQQRGWVPPSDRNSLGGTGRPDLLCPLGSFPPWDCPH